MRPRSRVAGGRRNAGRAYLLGRRLHILPRGGGAKGEDQLKLGGGQVLRTGFELRGPEHLEPPDPTGSAVEHGDLANAMQRGSARTAAISIRPFPTLLCPDEAGGYRRSPGLSCDLAGGGGAGRARSAVSLQYPTGIGLWKLVFLSAAPAVRGPDRPDPEARRGSISPRRRAIAANAIPRNLAGAMETGRWLEGAGGGRGREGAEHHARSGGSAAGRRGHRRLISRPASRPISTRSAAAWSRSRKISRCCPTLIARRWRPI